MTYMNASGEAVQAASAFYKIPADAITLFHDELDLAPGKIRVKRGGGAAGHNGLRSIDQHLGTPDYWRVRLGIGHPGHKDRVTGHVLGDFAKADLEWLLPCLDAVADEAGLLASGKPEDFMTKIALRTGDQNKWALTAVSSACRMSANPPCSTRSPPPSAAQAANYPFCTIEPNVGRVAVPDKRLDTLAAIGKSVKIVPTSLEFVDIAGLVRGASKGEGLGNQFLANIREVDAIVHVVRCFEDDDITHVEGSIDPVRDAETVETELMLADLESLQKRLRACRKRPRATTSNAAADVALMEPILAALEAGKPARTAIAAAMPRPPSACNLLTAKPVLYVCNVEEAAAATGNAQSARVAAMAAARGRRPCHRLRGDRGRGEPAPEADRAGFLADLGLEDSGLDRVIRAGYALLGLITYFTVGPKETRAWTIVNGTKAPGAAGVIHGDFERGFIACETTAYDDYVAYKGEAGAARGRQAAHRRPGLRGQGRRRAALPLQRLSERRTDGAESYFSHAKSSKIAWSIRATLRSHRPRQAKILAPCLIEKAASPHMDRNENIRCPGNHDRRPVRN